MAIDKEAQRMAKEFGPKALTVARLIEELQKMPQDAIVFTEGCDCLGEAASVEYQPNDGTVQINRS